MVVRGLQLTSVLPTAFGLEEEVGSNAKPNTWSQKILEWWLDIRKPVMTLFLGGMGLAWIITVLTRRDEWAEEGQQRRPRTKNKDKVEKTD